MALQTEGARARLIAHIRQDWLYYLWLGFLASLFLLGVYGYYLDRTYELADISNEVPWGLGIVIDVSSIALGAGAFVLVTLVYLLGRSEFLPLTRVAILVGMIGYSCAGLALLTDLGRPDRFWHILVHLNDTSVLSVVAWCLLIFTVVLGLQFLPIIRDAEWAKRIPILGFVAARVELAMPVLVLIGAFFSLTHQGAAGATFGVVKARAVWYRPTLPIVFAVTSVFAGLSFVLMLVTLTERLGRRPRRLVPSEILVRVARIAGYVGIGILVVRLWEQVFIDYYSPQLFFAQQTTLLRSQTPYAFGLFAGEFILGTVVPVIIFLSARAPYSSGNLIAGGALATFGLLINRWNTALSGLVTSVTYSPGAPEVIFNEYFPSYTEWLIALGIVAFAVLAYSLGIRILPIYRTAEDIQ